MPSTVALLFCAIFVVFLLWLDHKKSPTVSRALWLPTIWMIYTASKPIGNWFSSAAGDPELGSPMDRNFLTMLLFVSILLLIKRSFNWGNAVKENPWLILLLIFMLISIFWSSIPFVSFKRWTRELIAALMAFLVLSERSPRESMECILRRSTYVLIPFSVVLIKYFPEFGIQYDPWTGTRMWIGMALQKNGLGRMCLIAIFFLFWSLRRTFKGASPPVWKYHAHLEILVLIIALWLMRGPAGSLFYSATSFYTLCIGLLTYWGLSMRMKKGRIPGVRTFMVIVVIVVVLGTAALFNGASSFKTFASSAGRNSTLTGRTEIWAALLPIAMQRPILGHGFGGFWLTGKTIYFGVLSSHSGYLEVLMGLGFVGLLITSIFFLSAVQKAHRGLSENFDWSAFWIAFPLMTVVYGIAESSIDSFANHLTAITLFFVVISTRLESPKGHFHEDPAAKTEII